MSTLEWKAAVAAQCVQLPQPVSGYLMVPVAGSLLLTAREVQRTDHTHSNIAAASQNKAA